MKTKIIALFCACFVLLTVVDMTVPRSESEIYDSVIRLHILAEDDSAESQNVKLLVRDAILSECSDLFESDSTLASAESTVAENLSRIESVADRVLSENGFEYTSSAELDYEEYPTRVYENITLPAGRYRSLRLKLGSGEGRNWWCVLFPPLCNKASASSEDFASTEVDERDSGVFMNKKYIFRFKLLELFW